MEAWIRATKVAALPGPNPEVSMVFRLEGAALRFHTENKHFTSGSISKK